MPNHETQFLKFADRGKSASGLTGRWTVENKNSPVLLGWIEWHAPWRRYWFCPVNGTGFDASCLTDIADFLKARMTERK